MLDVNNTAHYLGAIALTVLMSIMVWGVRQGISKRKARSYEALLREKQRLDDCIWSWKYPDGSLVPQHKREKMFRDLRRVARRLRAHPDHPDNQQ